MLTNRSTIHMYLFCLGVLLMVIGFLCSRLLLSTGMIAVIANGFAQGDLRERLGRFSTDKLSMGISSLFLLPFLSGLWSSDKQTWAVLMLDKLPLLLLPFAMVQQKGIGPKQLNRFKLLWIVAMFAGSVWSTLQYLFAFRYFNHAYQFSQVIPTPVAGDHIRFSMGIIIALLFYLQLYERKDQQGKAYSLLSAIALWLVFYLHLLGAKTGLVGLYAVVLPFFLFCLYRSGERKKAWAVLFLLFSLPFLAYAVLPTFRVRVHYVLFEKANWQSEQFAGRFSDANRWASIQSGWYVFKKHPVAGAGYGDVQHEAEVWYKTNAPAITASGQFLPLNQWMMSGSGAGIPAVLLFTFVALMPFFLHRWKKQYAAIALVLFMNFVFLYESTIDDQFGVFLYCFFILYWNYSVNLEKNELLKCSPSPL